ncbi:MAG: riboflavin synthase [Myxococcales bacterium]|nr:MAG: riboflavin synthase [Myxococcales bacterium]
MFTGLIEDVGEIRKIERLSEGLRVEIAATLALDDVKLGDSIACDGACLTVVALRPPAFAVELSHETVRRTTWQSAKVGQGVNLEKALRLSDRLGGHLVSGHVDGMGRVLRRTQRGPALDVVFGCGPEILRYVVEKGSIAVDGVSLTVNAVDANGFGVTLIPHTQGKTTLTDKREGATVNLETDVIAKYVEKLLHKDGALDRELLAKLGYLK